uniref:Chromatin assembly factor 1 subunit p150 C-terminal domain-containing protein n=1 Tax=Anopheles culicifacies TaxID=139723 RepID=A0A182MFR2_9DIPT
MEVSSPLVAKDGSKVSPGANVRKMKQSRLPFQFFTTPAAKPREELGEARKRKPSTEAVELGPVAKAGRISNAKENDATLAVEGKNRHPAGANVNKTANDQDKPSGSVSSNSGRSLSAKKSNNNLKIFDGESNDSPKILIKLPIGKRKRSTKDKSKTTKKKSTGGDNLNLSLNPNESIILDDSDLSDDGAEDAGKDTSCTSNKETVALSENNLECAAEDGCKEQISDSEEESTKQADESITETQAAKSLEPLDKGHEQDSNVNDGDLLSESAVELESSKLPDHGDSITVLDTSSEVDSSEDIYLLCTPNSKTVPNEEEKKVRKLTPKQIAQRQDHEKRRALKQQEKLEKRRQLQEEKEEKAREKEEQERLRKKEREEKEDQKRREREEKELMKRKDREEREEQKRKEREEKEEQKRKEREEKEKKRQAEIDQKNEEKRLKEEERRKKEEQKEEERKRKEEEKEAEEKRKQKVAQAFTSFFVKKSTNGGGVKASDDENSVESTLGGITGSTGVNFGQQRFMPFCVKGDMRLAPTVRRVLSSARRDYLEKIIQIEDGKQVTDRADLYVELLKRKSHNPLKTDRTWNVEDDEDNDDIMIVDENVCHQIEADPGKMKQKFKTKFFLFEENRRPPYRGTWRKRSACIKARRPFVQDTKYFDYEVDSDDEWEEEEPGESLHGSDDEKDVDPEEDYEVDNEFFVPHGHLSDEELHAEEEGENDDNSPETQKVKLKIMQQEFVAEMKKKTEKIKPRLIGCIWEKDTEDANRYTECSALIRKMLDDRAMLFDPDEPISFTRSVTKVNGFTEQDSAAISPSKDNEKPSVKKTLITDDAVPDLVRLIHGNVNNHLFLVREFHTFWASRENSVDFSLKSIKNKIKEIAKWGPCSVEGSMQGKMCWSVEKDVLEKYDLVDLTLPNEWKYHLQKRIPTKPEKKTILEKAPNRLSDAGGDGDVKLTKPLSETNKPAVETSAPKAPEKEKDTSPKVQDKVENGKAGDANTKGATGKKSKKRVPLLMSVPRGQNINQTTKNSLISQFLSKQNSVCIEKMAELNRAKWKCVFLLGVMLICACETKSISEDVEELDEGYKLEPIAYDTVIDEDGGVLELGSSLQPFVARKIRDKRHAKYRILESPGLISHFRSSDRKPSRAKRHTTEDLPDTTEKQTAREDVAVAEKQTMNAPHKSSEFQAKVVREESDSDGEESMFLQEGIKSRAPRVNFVTQQTKGSLSSSEPRDSTANDKLIRELYRKPLTSMNYERSLPRTYDSYMATSQSPMYPRVYNKYDSFHRDMMDRMHPPAPHRYDHYYERRHDVEPDSYFPRYKYPYYYYYPDRRYDVPLYYRDRNYLYTNEIEQPPVHHGFPMYNMPLPTTMIRSSAPAMRNRRIIYFATLPEIVRPHPKEPYNQRLYQANRYEPYNTRVPQTATSTYKDSRPQKNDGKGDKYVSSKPIKIVREINGAANRTYLHRELPDDKGVDQQQQRSWSNPKEPNRSGYGYKVTR